MVQPVFQHESCYTACGKPASHIVAFSIHGQKDVAAAWSNDDGGPGSYRAIWQERSQRGFHDVSYRMPARGLIRLFVPSPVFGPRRHTWPERDLLQIGDRGLCRRRRCLSDHVGGDEHQGRGYRAMHQGLHDIPPYHGPLQTYESAEATGPSRYLGNSGYEHIGKLRLPAVTLIDFPGATFFSTH